MFILQLEKKKGEEKKKKNSSLLPFRELFYAVISQGSCCLNSKDPTCVCLFPSERETQAESQQKPADKCEKSQDQKRRVGEKEDGH